MALGRKARRHGPGRGLLRRMRSLLRFLALVALACHACGSAAAAVASGRHWQLAIESLGCEAAQSLVTIGARVRYLGRDGVVEAPVTRLVDGSGKGHAPRGVVWQGGSKLLASWLSGGGLRNLKSGDEA